MSRSPQLGRFFAQTDERICHLSSLPTRNKYWAIFRLSICKAKILNGCKSCSGVIVGHLPPMFSNHFYPCYPRTNKINFSLQFFHFKRKCFFKGELQLFEAAQLAGQLNRLSPSPLLCIFARLKEKLSLEKCADWWVVIFEFFVRHAFRTSSHFRVHFSAFTILLLG